MNKQQLEDLLFLSQEEYNDDKKVRKKAILATTNAFLYVGSHILGKNLQNQIIENNTGDAFLCGGWYFIMRMCFNKKASAIGAFGGASFAEFLQWGFKGYDPKDFAAYAIGAGLAYTLDNLLTKQK
ncbi:MAG: hypothetical protein Q8R18_03455 [bacterium]|nr:hypothetical protein [bacterium]